MPPDGYESVTLPTDLVESLDNLNLGSQTATIRHLLAEYKTSDSTDDNDLPDGFLDVVEASKSDIEELKRMVDEMPKRTADELETRLR